MKAVSGGLLIGALLGVLLLSDSAQAARRPEAGSKVTVLVALDRATDKESEADRIKARNDLGAFMERDLVNKLNRAGFESRAIARREDFSPAPNRYLLFVTLTGYHPVSGAARFWFGMAAGTSNLVVHYELWGQESSALLAQEVNDATMRDVNKLGDAVDQKIVGAVTPRLKEIGFVAETSEPKPSAPAPSPAEAPIPPAKPASDSEPASSATVAGSTLGRYSEQGITFEYDPSLTPEKEAKDNTVSISLKGNSDLLLMIQLADLPLHGEQYTESLVQGMQQGLKGGGAKVERVQATRRRVGERDRPGKCFLYNLAGAEMKYEAYGWDVVPSRRVNKILVICVQYPKAEEMNVKPLIETTLRSLQYAQAK